MQYSSFFVCIILSLTLSKLGCLIAVGGLWGYGEKEECSTLVTVNAIGVESNSPGELIEIRYVNS
jgi:hypothetical protein